MAISLGLIAVGGLLVHGLFSRLKLPGFLGLLLLGMVLGPYGINFMDAQLMQVSGEFRKIALIVILLRAGLGISRKDLNQIGPTALAMSIIPGLLEGLTVMLGASLIFGWPWIEGGLLGFVLAAVSPAVIVPAMLKLQSEGYGQKRGVPTVILASASIDDVVAITIFSSFLGLYLGTGKSLLSALLWMPVGILLGILLGAVVGLALVKAFRYWHIRDTKKVMYIVGSAILLTAVEELVKPYFPIASLMGVMTMGLILLEFLPKASARISIKFSKVWILAEVLLFVLVGAQVKVPLAFSAGLMGLALLVMGLVARSAGVLIATAKSGFDSREKAFATVAFWPKATVQAAMGAVPLMAGVPKGELILAIAVLSILVSAPLGALAIEATAHRWLEKPHGAEEILGLRVED